VKAVARRFSKIAIVCGLACSIGLNWAFLQAIAWANMVTVYSRDVSLAVAISKTFDGKHPCMLCKSIAEGKRTEKKSKETNEVKKLEFPCAINFSLSGSIARYSPILFEPSLGSILPHGPPAPPPRIAG